MIFTKKNITFERADKFQNSTFETSETFGIAYVEGEESFRDNYVLLWNEVAYHDFL